MSFDKYKYQNIEDILKDIKSIKIQGATNVAIATFEGIKIYLQNIGSNLDSDIFEKAMSVGSKLAYARPNEPLAQNGLKFLNYFFKVKYHSPTDSNEIRQILISLCDEYLGMIRDSKEQIVQKNLSLFTDTHYAFTHCHSSTAERLIYEMAKGKEGFKVVCTETRPLFQGRITAANLLDKGLDTTLIADSAAETYIIGRAGFPVQSVFLGADEITIHGDFVNKVGSWGIGLASYYANIPVYVVTPLLKVNPASAYQSVEIEVRESDELWPEAPKGLKMFNPAFDFINKQFVAGFLTEFGLVKPEDVVRVLRENYGWVF
ncbi:MAG TPA: translation initiation factor eIF-2B [Candidatus Dojkabacteria bacterium]|nr:translation initiation factor eIF-2B [Candidatus Dojkabacteria bacterium]